ncbi:DUF368 domain-containing protein [Mangrovimonas futianensis]|uniref:DUF368 domain-containing protein n=1 Tax=Mangrovimonas futianensis TaxID=2895523 RepID=UPI001E38EC8E|nr:DUF368 domain-containing protein [Mangrovimonas futianensis]MCF1422199.1 DUF368 domain-containing protein [Mangrovimonas futianensis]
MQRHLKDYFIISLKGVAMGAADAVPGVSGGTIAFIAGIYEELINTIGNVNFSLFTTFRKHGFKAFWNQLNGGFLIALLLGIVTSFVTFMQLAKYLIEYHPVLIWSFFFGLILASIYFVGKQIKKWNPLTFISIIIGSLIAFYVTTLPSLGGNDHPLFLSLAGALAICAMILPGISGSFILVILGAYKTLSDALHNFDFKRILLFIAGAVVGLLTFSRILKWLFKNYYNTTLALLTGFIIGSLNKIWPWKETLTVLKNETGEVVPFQSISDFGTLAVYQKDMQNFETLKTVTEQSVSPFHYSTINNQLVESQLGWAIVLTILGFLTIFLLERIGNKQE